MIIDRLSQILNEMNEFILVAIIIILVVWVILWITLPFAISGINNRLSKIIKLLDLNNSIQNDINQSLKNLIQRISK